MLDKYRPLSITGYVVEPYPSEKYEFVSWDDYSILFPIHGKMFQTINQIINGDCFAVDL